jgi:hypothetical protein
MTIRKCLVTVSVDNVFRNFLEDSERYELVDHVEHALVAASEGGVFTYISTIENERIMSFLQATLDNFVIGANALTRCYSEDTGVHAAVVRDRALRCASSLSADDDRYDYLASQSENTRRYTMALFSEFRDLLRKEHIALEMRVGTWAGSTFHHVFKRELERLGVDAPACKPKARVRNTKAVSTESREDMELQS